MRRGRQVRARRLLPEAESRTSLWKPLFIPPFTRRAHETRDMFMKRFNSPSLFENSVINMCIWFLFHFWAYFAFASFFQQRKERQINRLNSMSLVGICFFFEFLCNYEFCENGLLSALVSEMYTSQSYLVPEAVSVYLFAMFSKQYLRNRLIKIENRAVAFSFDSGCTYLSN